MSFTCPQCGRTSHSPTDEAEGYCGTCHDFTGRVHSHVRLDDGTWEERDEVLRTKTGKILTEADIERMATEAERGISELSGDPTDQPEPTGGQA